MKPLQKWLRRISPMGFILLMGVSMSACSDRWKEEVQLHDGSKIIAERSQSYGGRHEIGQSPPIKEQDITFTLPGTRKRLTFKSEYGDDIQRANFNLLAVHVLNGTPYVVASPNLCLSYNKWGRPNPPYVIFKHDGQAWQRIPLQEMPGEFKDINLVIDTKTNAKEFPWPSPVAAELVRKLNGRLPQPEYKTILREPLPEARIKEMCMELVLYKGAWVMPNDPIARNMIDLLKKDGASIHSGDKK
jgi:hypothetical protein